MFRKSLQSGLMSLLVSTGQDPLVDWAIEGKGCVKRILDDEAPVLVIEITSAQFCSTWIKIPRNPKTALGIRLPYLTLVIKYLKLPLCLEFVVLDHTMSKRRFRASNCQSRSHVDTMLCHLPMALNPGWNQVKIDMSAFLRNAYQTEFMELQSLQLNANCRVRAIFFSDRWYDNEELPEKYKLKQPKSSKQPVVMEEGHKNNE